ncbi:lanthionine synthetase LanC family protein [Eubacterium limosum]|uniref:lanthionine synthetase LanC family protein n=1 Tax=Eubacterium limosum TaxID=1736 RepID=UPI00106345D8|nr:lanthionine synthetase LanC family protein [Eubacterium limosum]
MNDLKINNYLNLDSSTTNEVKKIIIQYISKFKDIIRQNEFSDSVCWDYLISANELLDINHENIISLDDVFVILKKIKYKIESGKVSNIGLYGGLCGLSYEVLKLRNKTGEFNKFYSSLNALAFSEINKFCDIVTNNLNNIWSYYYDLISGLSGTIVYLVECDESKERNTIINRVCEVLNNIVLGKHEYKDKQVPNLHIKNSHLINKESKKVFVDGNLNFGVAHGIISILVALTKVETIGLMSKQTEESIKILKSYYYEFRRMNSDKILVWPEQLSYSDFIKKKKNFFASSRQSWCYGPIGVSSVLLHNVGISDDNYLFSEMYNNIVRIASISTERYQLESPIICHGYAGMLSMLLCAYKKKKSFQIYTKILSLIQILIQMYVPKSLYGYKDVEYKHIFDGCYKKYYRDDDSFLEGTTGIIMVLIALIKKQTTFEKYLLIQ